MFVVGITYRKVNQIYVHKLHSARPEIYRTHHVQLNSKLDAHVRVRYCTPFRQHAVRCYDERVP